ncbi:4-(cytidine 5'-diphospho)-2-C-methyl-D-erythritol kinase [Planctomycetota bacterium]|nr:4-(cytidine 5'-diphospho)-2-C-methyl-D-erythritol kinase [Planctomycetota bacterium]
MAEIFKIFAPAKVNWFLEIKGKRDDGFHEIETVMQAVDLFDELEFENISTPEIQFSCDLDLGDVKDNLVYRAAEAFRQEFAPNRGAKIHLTKVIPHGAGLGGGSSDAANAIVGLDRLWSICANKVDLERVAGKIGSDCSFFINGGISFCTGRGEQVAPMPDAEACNLVLLYPEFVCPTGKVYSNLAEYFPFVAERCYLFHDLEGPANCTNIAGAVFNRLQEPALAVGGDFAEAWNATSSEHGVKTRFVSGSGSTIAFLMEDNASALELRKSLEARQLGRVFAVKTLKRGTTWGEQWR